MGLLLERALLRSCALWVGAPDLRAGAKLVVGGHGGWLSVLVAMVAVGGRKRARLQAPFVFTNEDMKSLARRSRNQGF